MGLWRLEDSREYLPVICDVVVPMRLLLYKKHGNTILFNLRQVETWKHVISEPLHHFYVCTCLVFLWSQCVKYLGSFSLQEWQC